jgi:hypothetical protein
MPRVDAEALPDDASRVYIAARLAEAQRVEAVLTEDGADYAVSVELFRAGLLSRPHHGAVFYVAASRAGRCRTLLVAAGLTRGLVAPTDGH